jgi:DNA-binding cell septation regulator SpoVG
MMSGVSRETDFQMLNAHLAAKADNLELSEEKLWRYFALYEGTAWSGSIDYPDNFNIKDKANNLQMLIQSRAAVSEPKYQQMLEHEIMELNLGDDELEKYLADPSKYLASDLNTEIAHPVTTSADRTEHIQEMIMEGYTDQQMLEIHSEISSADILAAKTELLNESATGSTQV